MWLIDVGPVALLFSLSNSSQLLVMNFTIDSITVTPKQTTTAPGINFMTDFDEWLFIQV